MDDGPRARVELLKVADAAVVLSLSGPLDVESTALARSEVEALVRAARPRSLLVDVSGVARADMSGMSLIHELAEGRIGAGVRARVEGLRPELRELLSAFPTPEELESLKDRPEKRSVVADVGAAAQAVLEDVRAQLTFLGALVQAFGAALRRPRAMRWHEVASVFEKAGVDALPIVSLISLLMGLVIAFEAAQPLEMFGVQIFVANMIGLVMIREFSPIFTAIIFAGRSGSAFAAGIGTMKVNQELDALRTMGLEPIGFLVVQRVLAGTLLMPVLSAYSMLVGIVGGVLVMLAMGFPLARIGEQMVSALGVHDVVFGISKSVVFGAIIAALGCLRGLQTSEGPNAVGESTTRAVVAGILMIIVVDAIFSVLAYQLRL